MLKRFGFTAFVLMLVLLLGVLVSCSDTSGKEALSNSQTETQTEADELIPESKPKNMDTSINGVIIDAKSDDFLLRFRDDGTGILIGSVYVTYDKDTKTFLMEDGRKIELKTARTANVDGVEYKYTKEQYDVETRYIFDCAKDEKQLRIHQLEISNQMVVHLAFNYAMNENKLAIDFDYTFYGKDAELYTVDYSIDEYRGTIKIGDKVFDYSNSKDRMECLLSSKKTPRSYWLYPEGKGRLSINCELEEIKDRESYVIKSGEADVSISLVNDTQAEVNGALFDYKVISSSADVDQVYIFSKASRVSYRLFLFESDLLPPGANIEYQFDYTFDGSELKMNFDGVIDDEIGIYNKDDRVVTIDQNKYTFVGTIPLTK